MELQIVEPFALKLAQRTVKVGRLSALVLQMTPDVPLELVLFFALYAIEDPVFAYVLALHANIYKQNTFIHSLFH